MHPDTHTIYLAGPMRGYPLFNFPAFDTARNALRAAGFAVICPAEMDRERGFDPATDDASAEFMAATARRDLAAISRVDAIIVLPGFTGSRGVRAELAAARWIGMPVHYFHGADPAGIDLEDITDAVDVWLETPTAAPRPKRRPPSADVLERTDIAQAGYVGTVTVLPDKAAPVEEDTDTPTSPRRALLDEAADLVDGDRNAQYGDPRQDFNRTAAMWTAYLGVDVVPHDVAALMALLKVSRLRWSPDHRDNWTDLAGYAACGWDCARDD